MHSAASLSMLAGVSWPAADGAVLVPQAERPLITNAASVILKIVVRINGRSRSRYLPAVRRVRFRAAKPCRTVEGARPPCERSEEHTSELQSLMRISYAVFCLKTK